MKIKYIRNGLLLLPVALLVGLSSCKDSYLEPKAPSLYEPETGYSDINGLYAALTAGDRNMTHEYYGDAAPIVTEMVQSDICVEGTTDKAGVQMDMDHILLPDDSNNKLDKIETTRVAWYWNQGFYGIKYANTVINRIDDITYDKEEDRNALLGSAYFQRAIRYYKLVHQFGDVPYIDWEVTEPTYNLNSYDRWSIMERMMSDLEFAYKWVPEVVDRGKASKAGCGALLMKYCMELGKWDRAIEIGKEIVANHPLVTERFTANAAKPNTNLMHDLHSVEAKLDMSNKEGLMYIISYPGLQDAERIQSMRQAVPYWNFGAIKTPDGQNGTSVNLASGETDASLDLNKTYGRGIGRLRPSNYFQYEIWTEKEKNDLRGRYNRDSWKRMEDLKYNDPMLKQKGSEWYGKNFVKPVAMTVEDTIRCWFSWPHYKVFVPDPLQTEWAGGETPWYIFRSAEVYLLMAEAYYWKDQPAQAAEMLNVVRQRAGADPLTAADIGIGAVLDERARELYYEEARHTELVRIAYTYAKTGKPCEATGHTYTLENFSGPGEEKSNIKQPGVNFWYDWVMAKNNFYRDKVTHKFATYRISVHHVLWPVPASSINANYGGTINQNKGYPGADKNIEPLKVPAEGTVGPA